MKCCFSLIYLNHCNTNTLQMPNLSLPSHAPQLNIRPGCINDTPCTSISPLVSDGQKVNIHVTNPIRPKVSPEERATGESRRRQGAGAGQENKWGQD